MNVELAASLSLPLGKCSYVPLSSSNGLVAYSTTMANGIHFQKVHGIEDSDSEVEEEEEDEQQSDGFFKKVWDNKCNNVFSIDHIALIKQSQCILVNEGFQKR